jgi:hypothetical protein
MQTTQQAVEMIALTRSLEMKPWEIHQQHDIQKIS